MAKLCRSGGTSALSKRWIYGGTSALSKRGDYEMLSANNDLRWSGQAPEL